MRKVAVLCDFDGTVAGEDVGNLLFHTFTTGDGTHAIIEKWKEGLISSRECLEKECAMASASKEQVDKFLKGIKLDPYFKDFFDFTQKGGIEVAILSDGLDYYIEKLLCRFGLGHIDFYANKLTIRDCTLLVEFPYFDPMDCIDCGNCKLYHLEKYRKSGFYVVYVGDGLSDRCPAEHADLVFAKGDLLNHCEREDISFIPYKNFRDIEKELLRRLAVKGDELLGE